MDQAKLNAAKKALEYVKGGMVIGMGSGSTAEIFVAELADLAKKKEFKLTCVPTSEKTAALAKDGGLDVVDFKFDGKIDLAVDGADQVDSDLNLIKGYGGAMLREKLVDCKAEKFVVIVDESKIKSHLGGRVPLEVLPRKAKSVIAGLRAMGFESEIRVKDSVRFVTDNGNIIIDVQIDELTSPLIIDAMLKKLPGVIETGIFAGCVWRVIVGMPKGVKVLK